MSLRHIENTSTSIGASWFATEALVLNNATLIQLQRRNYDKRAF